MIESSFGKRGALKGFLFFICFLFLLGVPFVVYNENFFGGHDLISERGVLTGFVVGVNSIFSNFMGEYIVRDGDVETEEEVSGDDFEVSSSVVGDIDVIKSSSGGDLSDDDGTEEEVSDDDFEVSGDDFEVSGDDFEVSSSVVGDIDVIKSSSGKNLFVDDLWFEHLYESSSSEDNISWQWEINGEKTNGKVVYDSYFGLVNMNPVGITYANGYFWILDDLTQAVYKYHSNGSYTNHSEGFSVSDYVSSPAGITYANGYFWILDDDTNSVYKYHPDGGRYTNFSVDYVSSPSSITYANGYFWILDRFNFLVHKYHPDGRYAGHSEGLSIFEVSFFTGITYANGYFWILDDWHNKMLRYHASILDSSQIDVGDNVTLRLSLNDSSSGKVVQNVVINEAITAYDVSVNSDYIHVNESLNCSFTRGDFENVEVNWYRNGALFSNSTYILDSDSVFYNVLNAENTSIGDIWACKVVAVADFNLEKCPDCIVSSDMVEVYGVSNVSIRVGAGELSGDLFFDYLYRGGGDSSRWQWRRNGEEISEEKVVYSGKKFDVGDRHLEPSGVTYVNDYLWVVDKGGLTKKLHKYYLSNVSAGISESFRLHDQETQPFDIVYAQGYLWILDNNAGNKNLHKYYLDGTYTNESFKIEGDDISLPIAITYANGYFWVTDKYSNSLHKCQLDGKCIVSFNLNYSYDNNSMPIGISYANGYFWVVDRSFDSVYKYHANGSYIGDKFDLKNMDSASITYANGYFLVLDMDKNIYKYHANVLSSDYVDSGDNVSVHLIPSNGNRDGDMVVQSVIIYDAISVENMSIGPSHPTFSDDLNCSFVVNASYVSEVSVDLEWYRNGVFMHNKSMNVRAGDLVYDVLEAKHTSIGDKWRCEVIAEPYDTDEGMVIGDFVVSEEVVLGILSSVVIQSDSGKCLSTDSLWFDYLFFNEDNSHWQWEINGNKVDGNVTYDSKFDVEYSGHYITYANGYFWILDDSTDSVYKYNPDGSYTNIKFGIADHIGSPAGITYANGYFWILDDSTDSVYKYHPDGSYTNHSEGFSVSGQVGMPVGITYANGYFWIVDRLNSSVYKYHPNGSYSNYNFTVRISSGITYVNGYFWLVSGSRIYRYHPNGTYIDSLFLVTNSGSDITYANGYFWITEGHNHIYKYRASVLNSSLFNTGDNITLHFTSGGDDQNMIVRNVAIKDSTINNNITIEDNVTLSPKYAMLDRDLTCSFIVNGNIDKVDVDIGWYRNNDLVYTDTIMTSMDVEVNNVLKAERTFAGDVWMCEVTGLYGEGDNFSFGASKRSASAYIEGSKLSNFRIKSESEAYTGNDDLWFDYLYKDDLEDNVYWQWKVDGKKVDGEEMVYDGEGFGLDSVSYSAGVTYVDGGFWIVDRTYYGRDYTKFKVHRYDSDGTELTRESITIISGDGKSGYYPLDVVQLKEDGRSYLGVLDNNAGGNNFRKYDLNGEYLGSVGIRGENVVFPIGVIYVDGYLWVLDRGSKRVHRCSPDDGKCDRNFKVDHVKSPGVIGITYANGYFWITDRVYRKVYKYDFSGSYTGEKFNIGYIFPTGIVYANGYFWFPELRGPLHKYHASVLDSGNFASGDEVSLRLSYGDVREVLIGG